MSLLNGYPMTSAKDDWETPKYLFDQLDDEFHFVRDPCANDSNAKCMSYFTREEDGLVQDWSPGPVFCNPPYGREVGKWMQKAYEESLRGVLVVCLVPSRTDTIWWHSWVEGKAEVRFIKGRVKFQGAPSGAPFPSAIVIFRPGTACGIGEEA
jgi:site-specific DNA-methyltransferase (adenine-specific)